MKPWQKGIDLDTLLAHTKRFENYNKFSCSPFSEMKKNDIAEHLSNGTVVNLKGSTFTIQECKTRSPIYMYQDIPIGYRELVMSKLTDLLLLIIHMKVSKSFMIM